MPYKNIRERMRKFLSGFLFTLFTCFPIVNAAHADGLEFDTMDPLFMLAENDLLSETTLTYWDNVLRAGETLSYGINNRLTISANVHYQQDFNGPEDGFSSLDIGGVYRVATASGNSARIISDVLFGLKVGGSSHVRTPYFADSTYYAGYRFGRQWAGVTLAATIKSSWILMMLWVWHILISCQRRISVSQMIGVWAPTLCCARQLNPCITKNGLVVN